MSKGKEKFKIANSLQDEDRYDEAIDIYKDILNHNEFDRFEVLLQLGGAYYFGRHYFDAYDTYKLALKANADSEIVSLGFYLACSKVDKVHEGLLEMKRFLDNHPADLYNDTIDELLDGLESGYATDYKDIILGFKKFK